MKTNLLPAFKLTLVCLFFFSGIYTVIVLGIAQLVPNNGKGDIVMQNGKTYYTNIGQSFTQDQYFYSRPSAINYNAAGSGGSNKSIGNATYIAEVKARIDTFLVHNPTVTKADFPSDLVTASGSGLDPNISIESAKIQVKRIANIRNIREETVSQLIDQQVEKPLMGMFGTKKINVLKLNLALDQLNKTLK